MECLLPQLVSQYESRGGREDDRRSWSGGWRHTGGLLCPPASAALEDEWSYACSQWRWLQPPEDERDNRMHLKQLKRIFMQLFRESTKAWSKNWISLQLWVSMLSKNKSDIQNYAQNAIYLELQIWGNAVCINMYRLNYCKRTRNFWGRDELRNYHNV